MAYGRFAQEYRKGSVNGASPVQLVVMLYDGALRYMEAGKHAMQSHDLQSQNTNLQKAQRIVTELMSCLDMKQGEDIAKNLLALYTYVLNELIQANIQDDPSRVDRSIAVFSELRESWARVEESLRPHENESLAS